MQNKENTEAEAWDLVIEPKASRFDLQLAEMWLYRDLLILFVRRDFVSLYKAIIRPLFEWKFD